MRPKWSTWVGVAAFVVYVTGITNAGFPGESSRMLVQHSGLGPFPPLVHPVWTALVRLVRWIPVSTLAFRMNLLSALCGAITVSIFFGLAARVGRRGLGEDSRLRLDLVAGSVAAGLLAFSSPFWFASTRAHASAFDTLLLVLACRLVLAYRDTGGTRELFRFALLYGVGIAESSTFILFAPGFAAYLLLLMWRRQHLAPGYFLRVALCMASCLPVYAVYAWYYANTGAFEWRSFSNFFQVIWFMWREQWFLLSRSLGRTGWLLLVLISFLPWLLCLAGVRSSRNKARALGRLMLHSVVTVLVVVVFLNGKIAPWTFIGSRPLMITPYLFVAACSAYCITFWWHAISRRGRRRKTAGDSTTAMAVTAVVLAGLVLVTAVRNASDVQTRPARALHLWAAEVARAAEGRPWLVTDGLLDDAIVLAAHDAGTRITILNASISSHEPYARYIASVLPSERLQAMALVGLPALLKEWMATDPAIHEKLAIVPSIDFWLKSGLLAVPDRALYKAVPNRNRVDAVELLRQQEPFWSTLGPAARSLENQGGDLAPLGAELLRRTSQVANDLGVMLEYLEKSDLAARAYEAAEELCPENISAMLNRAELFEQRGDQRAAAQWEKAEVWLHDPDRRQSLLMLVRRFGHIRSMDAVQRIADVWEVADSAETMPPALRHAADMFLRKEFASARSTLEDLVDEQPQLDKAWILLGLVADAIGDDDLWTRCVGEMKGRGASWAPFLAVEGQRAQAAGDLEVAAKKLREAYALTPGNPRLLEELLKLQFRRGDKLQIHDYARTLLNLDPGNPWANFALGIQLYEQNEHGQAEVSFRKAVERLPIPHALNNLAWLLYLRGSYEEGLGYAKAAVEGDPTLYSAWDTLGILQEAMNQFEDASKSFALAAELSPDQAGVLLHQAGLYIAVGRIPEARSIAERLRGWDPPLSAEQEQELKRLLGRLAE